MNLSEEQRLRIEKSRQNALAIRASRQQPLQETVTQQSCAISSGSIVSFPQSVLPAKKSSDMRHFVSSKKNAPLQQDLTPCNSVFKNFMTGNSSKSVNKTYSSVKSGLGSGDSTVNSRKIKGMIDGSRPVAVKCLLSSQSRFLVDVCYHPPLIEVFKSMSTRQYDMQTKIWSFDLKEYCRLENECKKLGGAFVFEPLPSFVLRTFSNSVKGGDAINKAPAADLSKVDQKLVSSLLHFQRQGVNFAVWRKGRVLLADDMGLGKTLQALCVAAYYRSEWPLLIIVPSSVRFAWRQQILEWLPSVSPQDINLILSSKDSCTGGLINIVSYDLMTRCHEDLESRKFKVIIADESHFLKNNKSVRTKRALPLLKKASRVILLSGTPAMSRPVELYTQLVAVDPVTFKSFHEYGLRYCNAQQKPWGWDYQGSSNLSELQLLMEENFMIRRMKSDVLGQLPSKRRTMIVLDPSLVKLNKVLEKSHSQLQASKGMKRKSALLGYFHETGTAKIEAVVEYVLDLLEADRKFLFFAHHQEILDAVEEAVRSAKYKSVRIDGRTSAEQRGFFTNRFQCDADVRIAILSITAANAGLNLTAASLVVFAELFWNPGVLVQAEDRAHRIGQENSVNVYYLVARNTADDYIWPLIQDKLEVLGKAGLSKDDFQNTETNIVQDSKQGDLLRYFKESFIEEGDDTLSSSDQAEAAEVPTAVNANACPDNEHVTPARSPEPSSVDHSKHDGVNAEEVDWSDVDDASSWFSSIDVDAELLRNPNNNNPDIGVRSENYFDSTVQLGQPLQKKSRMR